MNPNSLFDVMLHSRSIIDRTIPEANPSQVPAPSTIPASQVYALFDFQSEIYKKGRELRFKVQKGIMPLKGDLFKILKDSYRRRKNDRVVIEWPKVSFKSAAIRDAKAYVKAIEIIEQQPLNIDAAVFLDQSKKLLSGLILTLESVITP